MYISDAKKFLSLIVKKGVHVSPLFVGSMGIGKSEIVRQVAADEGIALVDLRLAQMEPSDLIGIPYRKADKESGNDRTEWALPGWFPKEGTRGILHLDELNRAPNDTRQAVFQLIWDRQLHQARLPDGWTIVSSVNPSNTGYMVEELDPAMIRRFVVLTVTPHVDTWMEWAVGKGKISKDITGFIGTHKTMLFEPEDVVTNVKRNNAGWSVVHKLRDAGAIPQELEFEIISGIVGKEAAAAFRKYLDENYERPVAGEIILKDYKSVREKLLKQLHKADEMHVTITDIIVISENEKKFTKKQMENIKDLILDLTADSAAMLIHRLPAEIVSELGQDDRVTTKIGRALKQAKEEKAK